MCGIVGFVGFRDDALLVSLNESQLHRGPDDGGYYHDHQSLVYMAMRRLSIVDIADGHQPLSNSDQSVWIVFNGEIVNAPELREQLEAGGCVFSTDHSDTEVLIQLYDRYGEDMLSRLNGMFAFVIYDRRRRIVFGARDHFGIKPLYYSFDGARLVFASELKSLSLCPGLCRIINYQALYHYLSFQSVPSPHTIYEGVAKLRPGESFVFKHDTRQFRLRRYWVPPTGEIKTCGSAKTESQIAELIRVEFGSAIRRWRMSDIPIACSLSGGIDSSVIVGLMMETSAHPIHTYTLGFEGFDALDERSQARHVAKKWGTEHHEIVVGCDDLLASLDEMVLSLDEPYAGGLPSWFVFKGMANEVKVCMTGTGGDELFGNYGKWRVYEDPIRGIRQAIGFARQDWRWITDFNRFPIGSRYSMYFRDHEKRMGVCSTEWAADCEPSELLVERLWTEGRPASLRDAPRIIDMQLQLPDEFLHMTDRFSMAFSIEARPPFLDREFAEKMMSIPAKERIGRTQLKSTLINALRVYIPDELLILRKRGFVLPISQWLREELRHRVQALLSPEYLRTQGIFNERLYNEIVLPHLDGRRDNSAKLWTLFMFQLWYEHHISP